MHSKYPCRRKGCAEKQVNGRCRFEDFFPGNENTCSKYRLVMQTSLFVESGADFSQDRIYRYSLWRFWEKDKGYVAFIGLNPSTADENKDDPTIRRCINYAKDWGYGGLIMLNLFAYRSTDPKKLYSVNHPVGPENDFHLRCASSKAGITIAAWGNHGDYLNRAKSVIEILTKPHYLKLTNTGCPGHPLYLKKDLRPTLLKTNHV